MAIPDGVNLAGEGSAGILGRIRHGDPRVRLGAMTALSATILDADSLIAAAATASGDGLPQSSAPQDAEEPPSDPLGNEAEERRVDIAGAKKKNLLHFCQREDGLSERRPVSEHSKFSTKYAQER